MDVKIEMFNEVVVLVPVGNLVASTAEFFKSQVAKLLEKRFLLLLIDMSKTDFMDSSGLGACMAAHKSIAEQGGVLVCCNLNDTITKVFKITRAINKINTTEGRQEGIKMVQDLAIARREP
ncbi:MAG: STAS domain-containing protein [Deltaproteobacteria bacterium]|nr:STAS domain-containing protein [Deltaproteobacteria bacterium]